ncbi:hypothetical protein [Methanocella conradii]|uniref:hypothetical protein n=1 Tax=Methanocella conradii TaxID=1175444 RepID=UPI0024B32A7B|nr:hypothetical protein [Methanocella conradii]MDI6898184.1 hypothetical protein [Methanocella conradii]
MSDKNKMILIMAIISTLGLICIGLIGYISYPQITGNNELYNLEYAYQPNTIYSYDIVQTIEPGDEIVFMNISMLASDDGEDVRINMISNATKDEDYVLSTNNVTIDRRGNLIKQDKNSDFLPEVRPEIPIRIIYPEGGVINHSSWVINLNKTGSYITSNEIIEYNLTGVVAYYCKGLQTVKVKDNTFSCICIESNTTYNLYTKSNTSNGYLYAMATGKIDGSNWVDAEKGFLVKAVYNQNSTLSQDYSDICKKMGLFNSFKAEIPTSAHVTSDIIKYS